MAFILLAVLATAYACKKSSSSNFTCTPEKKTYTYQPGKQIDNQLLSTGDTLYEHYSYSIKDGDKNVFNFTLQFKDCPEIADDEGARIILFEIPQNVQSFQLKDSAGFRKAKSLLNYACFCAPGGPVLIKSGSIEGEKKSNNTWHIKASSITPLSGTNNTLAFEADFLLK
ncbi:MAG: hypothetical protein ABIN89_31030 [Chitinophagaceae bacterium]